jgi:putative ABC transport system permease protein
MRLSWRTAGRIAWRETRSSMARFVFVVLAVAMGVGALSGVRGFSQSVGAMLLTETRSIMAADLTARQFAEPGADQLAALDALARRGVDRTQVTETVSMASSEAPDAAPVLVSIKAVDPAKYPYYGTLTLSPPLPLSEALRPDRVVAGEDVFIRLGVQPGDKIRLGGEEFTIAAVVVNEPDRMSGSLNVGLRMMISREGFERTGLMQIGSRAAQRYLFKILPGGPSVAETRQAIRAALPGALVADSTEAHPLIARGVERATTFLSLVSLIALIVGAIGVAMAMYAHVQQKMDNIAVMKSLGGTSGEIIRIYTIQTLMLGLLGGAAGVVVGRVVEEAFPSLVSRIFEINAPTGWHAGAAVQGILVGVLTTLLFTVPPLLAIRKIRPALILRRDMPDAKLPLRRRLQEARGAVAAGALILAGLGGIAGWLAGSARVGGYFALGLTASLAALGAVAWALLRGIRAFLRRAPFRLPSLARQGLANIYRQGNQAQAILVAMGLGVMFTLSVYLVQSSLVADIIATAPPDVPNVFLIGVTQDQVEPLKALIRQQKGVLTETQLGASVSARLLRVDGQDIAARQDNGMNRRFQRPRSVTWEPELRDGIRVVQGKWWDRNTTEPVISLDEGVARWLDVSLGSVLEFDISNKRVAARVVATHVTETMRYTPDADFVFNPPALAGLPVVFYGGVRMEPSQVGAAQRAIYRAFPTVTVVNIADALAIVQQVIDQIALVIRFLSAFAILAGAIILAASVAGTRFRRVREVVILKTLGATRRHVGRIFSVEFLTLGAVAGFLGALLAGGFSNLVLTQLLESEVHVDWTASLASIALTAVLANAAGWLASFRILRQKPLEVLREE